MKHLKKASGGIYRDKCIEITLITVLDKLVNSISEEATLVIRQVFTDSAGMNDAL